MGAGALSCEPNPRHLDQQQAMIRVVKEQRLTTIIYGFASAPGQRERPGDFRSKPEVEIKQAVIRVEKKERRYLEKEPGAGGLATRYSGKEPV